MCIKQEIRMAYCTADKALLTVFVIFRYQDVSFLAAEKIGS